MNINRLVTVALAALVSHPCFSQFEQQLPELVREQAQIRIDNGLHLGTVIGVIDENGTRYYGFGQMSLTDKTVPNEDSIFEIASLTKPITAMLLADLQLKEEINNKTSVASYLPVMKNADKEGLVTLESLITHTSGLPRDALNTTRYDANRYGDYTIQDLNKFLGSLSIDLKPGVYSYSNLGFLILEHAVETETETTYESLLMERVINVLGMNNTYFDVPEVKLPQLVAGYRNGEHTDLIDTGQFPAMGGLKSTARDMLTFLGVQIGIDQTPLSNAITLTQQEIFRGNDMVMSLGWEILHRQESGKTIYHYSGGSNGFVSFAAFNLEDKKGVIVLVNGHRYFSDLGFKILDTTYPMFEVEE